MNNNEQLGQILLRANLINEMGLRQGLAQLQQYGGTLGAHLVRLGLLSEENLIRALSTLYRLPAIALDPLRLKIETIKMVPQDICRQFRLVCFRFARRLGLGAKHR